MKLYQKLISIESSLQSIFLLIIRLYWGWQLMLSGFGKLINVEGVTGFFASLNIPFPTFNVYLVGFTELIGGACLLLGLASRLVTIPIIFNMAMIYVTAHRTVLLNIFSDADAFVTDSPFLFLFVAIIVMVFGPGKLSLDYLIARDKDKI